MKQEVPIKAADITIPSSLASAMLLLLGLILCLLPVRTDAQKQQQRFSAGISLGINASQMDGDQQRGYHKLGIQGGLKGIARLSPRFNLNAELMYTQRGARPSPKGNDGSRPVTITLNYAETAFMLTYKTLEDWDGNQRLQLASGLSYARLLNSDVKESSQQISTVDPVFADKIDAFRSDDISWKLGVSYLITDRFLLGARHTISMVPLLSEDSGVVVEDTLSSYYFSLQATYIIL